MKEQYKQEIIDRFWASPKGYYTWLTRNKNNIHLVESLRKMFPNAESDSERVYWLVFDMKAKPVCPICGKPIPFLGRRSLNKNGYNDHCCHRCGCKDPHHQQSIKQTKLDKYGDCNWNNADKATETCKLRYGGNGVRGDREKAKRTMLERYKVESYLASNEVNSMRNNKDIQDKIQHTKHVNQTFNTSKPEVDCYEYLCTIYGKDNVVRQFKDIIRYPFNCDFYIKPLDMFIELNLFPTHYTEPFDENNPLHIEHLEHCKSNPKNWIEQQQALVWAGSDVIKRKIAKLNNLNYLTIYRIEELFDEESRVNRQLRQST